MATDPHSGGPTSLISFCQYREEYKIVKGEWCISAGKTRKAGKQPSIVGIGL